MKKIILLWLLIPIVADGAMQRSSTSSCASSFTVTNTVTNSTVSINPKKIRLKDISEEFKNKIRSIFELPEHSLADKILILEEDFKLYENETLELFGAAQACNYKELKRLFSEATFDLKELYKARALAEGKEYIFNGVSRIFWSDSDECVGLINAEISKQWLAQEQLQSQLDQYDEEISETII